MNYKQYFQIYLQEVIGVSKRSIDHYVTSVNVISTFLIELGKIDFSIFEIDSISQLVELKNFLFTNEEFIEKNKRGNNMYSVGFKHYLNFAIDALHFSKKTVLNKLDIVVPIPTQTQVLSSQWTRDRIIAKQSIAMANYCCEIDSTHKTFIAEATNNNYVEGHHVIPMSKQKYFQNSLDVYANVIALCPNCHKLFHYGKRDDIVEKLGDIYIKRESRMKNSGIILPKNDFISTILE